MKPQIRLPTDHGPNPYDSKTMPSDLHENKWLVSVGWWFTVLALTGGFVFMRWTNGSL